MTSNSKQTPAARAFWVRPTRIALALVAMGTLILAGCATVDIKQSIARVNQDGVDLFLVQ